MRLASERPAPMLGPDADVSLRTWGICGLMLLATMLNYMDRQALAQQATEIRGALELTNEDYGRLETGFGLAFAVGGIVDGVHGRPASASAGFTRRSCWAGRPSGSRPAGSRVTASSSLCRVMLGFFEAGQWPCALAASQRLLSRQQPSAGQQHPPERGLAGRDRHAPSSSSCSTRGEPGSWRLPFRVIGAAGLVWVVAWLTVIRPRDLEIAADPTRDRDSPEPAASGRRACRKADQIEGEPSGTLIRRFLALVVVVIMINFCWQYFRAWMPMMLEKEHGYTQQADPVLLLGLLPGRRVSAASPVGFLVKWLAGAGLARPPGADGDVPGLRAAHGAGLVVASLPASWLLLALLAGDRLRLARPVPHLLRVHPGALGAADGQGHRRAELRDLDLLRPGPEPDRPLDRPDRLLFRRYLHRRSDAFCGLTGAPVLLERSQAWNQDYGHRPFVKPHPDWLFIEPAGVRSVADHKGGAFGEVFEASRPHVVQACGSRR